MGAKFDREWISDGWMDAEVCEVPTWMAGCGVPMTRGLEERASLSNQE